MKRRAVVLGGSKV